MVLVTLVTAAVAAAVLEACWSGVVAAAVLEACWSGVVSVVGTAGDPPKLQYASYTETAAVTSSVWELQYLVMQLLRYDEADEARVSRQ